MKKKLTLVNLMLSFGITSGILDKEGISLHLPPPQKWFGFFHVLFFVFFCFLWGGGGGGGREGGGFWGVVEGNERAYLPSIFLPSSPH